MFVFGNFIAALARALDVALVIYMWIIIIRALISWVSPSPYNPIVRFLYRVTEPALRPVRRIIPLQGLGIDFSPVIVILIIIFLRQFVVASLYYYGQSLLVAR
jgi:YggT family protein